MVQAQQDRRFLRPIERRVLQLADEGMPRDEIALRFRRSPEAIDQVMTLATMPRPEAGHRQTGDILTPIERRVLRWREQGVAYDDLAWRFRASASFSRRVERLAHY